MFSSIDKTSLQNKGEQVITLQMTQQLSKNINVVPGQLLSSV